MHELILITNIMTNYKSEKNQLVVESTTVNKDYFTKESLLQEKENLEAKLDEINNLLDKCSELSVKTNLELKSEKL